jgi:hypothetical protein
MHRKRELACTSVAVGLAWIAFAIVVSSPQAPAWSVITVSAAATIVLAMFVAVVSVALVELEKSDDPRQPDRWGG